MDNYGLIREGAGNAVLRRIPVPHLRDDYILVKTVAVALNPTDGSTLDAKGDDGTIVGCDYAGIVEEVGPAVKRSFRKGDRVAGIGHGGNDANPENGAFARYIAVKGDIQMHIPDDVTWEAACTVGVGVATTGYALYKVLKIARPDADSHEENDPILIYGGSTATGSIAIQFAKLSGRKVVTTCSPKHFQWMSKLGADFVYDYHTSNIGQEIRRATGSSVKLALDTVNIPSSSVICADSIGSEGGIYCNLLGLDCPRPDVQSIFFLGYSISGESYIFEGENFDARPEDFTFATEFMDLAEKLWTQGRWNPHPQRIEPDGLLGVGTGMQQMREGKVSGEKLVYLVDQTDWSEARGKQ